MTRYGWAYFDSWAGRFRVRVEVLRETPKRFEVRFLGSFMCRVAGVTALAPKHAVRLDPEGTEVGDVLVQALS